MSEHAELSAHIVKELGHGVTLPFGIERLELAANDHTLNFTITEKFPGASPTCFQVIFSPEVNTAVVVFVNDTATSGYPANLFATASLYEALSTLVISRKAESMEAFIRDTITDYVTPSILQALKTRLVSEGHAEAVAPVTGILKGVSAALLDLFNDFDEKWGEIPTAVRERIEQIECQVNDVVEAAPDYLEPNALPF